MAEHALWSIWFRAGDPQATATFRAGVNLMAAESYLPAVRAFTEAAQIDPLFAEALNQRAIAHFFLYQWQESLDCSRKVICLNPTHFGAIAGMGHCFTQLGDLKRALACYRRAIQIHPRMTAVRRMIERLERYDHDRNDRSGFFVAQGVG